MTATDLLNHVNGNGTPTLVTCPCCNGTLRLSGTRLEPVRMTKPVPPWKPTPAPGSEILARQAIEAVCRANAITLDELRRPGQDRGRAAIRRQAARAAKQTGANAVLIGSILNRHPSTIFNFTTDRPR